MLVLLWKSRTLHLSESQVEASVMVIQQQEESKNGEILSGTLKTAAQKTTFENLSLGDLL